MAIIRSLGVGQATGSMGMITYRTVQGDTIGSQKRGKSSQKLTFLQARRAVQLSNLVAMWRLFAGLDRPSFEGRAPRVSDFNEFVSVNLGNVPVFFTRSEARQGAVVAAPYQVTRGSLPAIDVSASGSQGEIGTDISLGNLTIGESTTLAQFSRAVIDNNDRGERFRNGDAIICFVLRQSTNTTTGVPYCAIDEYKVTLNTSDNETLLTEFDPQGVAFTKMGTSDKLGMSAPVNGAVVYIHSRFTADGTKVSTQSFVASNTTLSAYQTDAKRDEAVISYGASISRLYLTPDVDAAIQGL